MRLSQYMMKNHHTKPFQTIQHEDIDDEDESPFLDRLSKRSQAIFVNSPLIKVDVSLKSSQNLKNGVIKTIEAPLSESLIKLQEANKTLLAKKDRSRSTNFFVSDAPIRLPKSIRGNLDHNR